MLVYQSRQRACKHKENVDQTHTGQLHQHVLIEAAAILLAQSEYRAEFLVWFFGYLVSLISQRCVKLKTFLYSFITSKVKKALPCVHLNMIRPGVKIKMT